MKNEFGDEMYSERQQQHLIGGSIKKGHRDAAPVVDYDGFLNMIKKRHLKLVKEQQQAKVYTNYSLYKKPAKKKQIIKLGDYRTIHQLPPTFANAYDELLEYASLLAELPASMVLQYGIASVSALKYLRKEGFITITPVKNDKIIKICSNKLGPKTSNNVGNIVIVLPWKSPHK